ncbi:uncharacterized protein A4U43_C09F13840 [Asparagus officinalis]|uniref:CBS domain-containing protein n=1 Tax=Asparagus officinalis TaxID=4686 RepID=A0A5P1E778_ASPOF|nr:CBS domain-containing protein CBSCBSPB1-like [Asparagus officinalis]ONK58512.1 uncharacterized protein A4U43_C09F13840 [Asparagus officinalis]
MDGLGSSSSSSPHRRSSSVCSSSSKKMSSDATASAAGGGGFQVVTPRKPPLSRSTTLNGERTVKRLRLTKALTMPENSTVYETCRRMAARGVDAALLTDSNALLCGILTAKDITTRVIARELKLEEIPVSKVMTRNPVFVLSDTLAVEALQKMVLGKFRHLPVVENGEVIALLDIAKCLYDAIARMERAAEKGKAVAAAVEGVEKHWGTSVSGPNTFIETLQERLFRPSLSTIISGSSKVLTVLPTDTVLAATQKMLEFQISSAVVTIGNKLQGILTSSDILLRVIAKNLSPESTSVEKVMTQNPECGTIDTPILDALHIMHNGRFLHLPVLDRDGQVVSIIDVIHVTNAAVATVENSGGLGNESTVSMMQKFWDSAMAIGPIEEDEETKSEASMKLASDGTDILCSPAYPRSGLAPTFAFKLEDKRGRMHRFYCDTRTLTELITSILQRVGDDIDKNHLPQILYEDEDRDKVVLASDSDLAAAVEHARVVGWTGLRLYLDYSGTSRKHKNRGGPGATAFTSRDAWASAYSTIAAGAALVAGLGVMAYLRRSS